MSRVISIYEAENEYCEYATNIKKVSVSLGKWLPEFEGLRRIVPGELCFIMADTGAGKTMALQQIAMSQRPNKVLFCEMELPTTLSYERLTAMSSGITGRDIEKAYETGKRISCTNADHIYLCSECGLTLSDLEEIILTDAVETMDGKPNMVVVDYIGLMVGEGTRSTYERISQIATGLKVLSKRTNTVVFAACQIHRKGDEEAGELYLHDARDSGAIEQSSGLLLGIWRDPDDKCMLNIKVIKQTKGEGGLIVKALVDWATMTIKPDTQELDQFIDDMDLQIR